MLSIKKSVDKKGISPLVATILLVGFVIAIGSIVIFWGRNFIKEKAEKEGALAEKQLKCEDIEIDIKAAGAGSITVENKGNDIIDAFVIRVVSGGSGAARVEQKLNPLEVKDISLGGLSLRSGESAKVDIIPALKPEGINAPLVPCSSKHKVVKVS